MIRQENRKRFTAIFLVFSICFILLYYRLVILQVVRHEELLGRALSLHRLNLKIDPRRGTIYDCRERPLAMSVPSLSLYGIPREVSDSEETARIISPLIDRSESFIKERLSRDKDFIWLSRKLTPEKAAAIRELSILGLRFREESTRVYPQETLLCHVLGFTDIDNRGLEGIELSEDNYLRGQCGWRASQRDRKGREIITLCDQDIPPVDGYDILLTVDTVIQHHAERELEKTCLKYNARGGCVIVMDPKSGAVLACANWPVYDPNNPGDFPAASRRNRAITDIFEPGSTFKVITIAAALEEGGVTLDDRFFCENGAFYYGGHTLHDVHAYGELSTAEIIQKSSNIGAAKVAMDLGAKRLSEVISRFGFGEPSNLGLPGEVSGILRPLRMWTKLSLAAIPMGHEIGVTAIQMASAVAALANGGLAMKPYLIKEVRDSKGEPVRRFVPQARRRVIRETTAQEIVSAMEAVVSREGTAYRAHLEEYTVAGKTGTAQKLNADGTYSHSDFIASFIGFVPARDPEVLVMVMIDEPKPVYYGGVVAAPVFKEIAETTLKRMGVPPDKRGKTTVASRMEG